MRNSLLALLALIMMGACAPVIRGTGDLGLVIERAAGRIQVIEATGHPEGLGLALEAVRPRGTVVLKSTFAGEPTWNAAKVVIDEITLVGSRCGRCEAALTWLAETGANLTPLVTARFGLEDGEAALARAGEAGVLKVLIDPREA